MARSERDRDEKSGNWMGQLRWTGHRDNVQLEMWNGEAWAAVPHVKPEEVAAEGDTDHKSNPGDQRSRTWDSV
jgi:hypothetical protein